MAGGTVVAEQGAAGLADDLYQAWIAPDLAVALRLDLGRPDGTIERRLLEGFSDCGALVPAEQALGVGRSDRPCRHQDPVTDGEERGRDQEKVDHPRHRRVQLLDAVPFMSGGQISGLGIALFY